MDLVARVKNIIFEPKKEWETIKGETTSVVQIYKEYVVILAAIPAVAGFIGQLIRRGNFANTLSYNLLVYVLSLAGVYILALTIDFLAQAFGAKKDFISSLKVAAFSSTAGWIAGALLVFPKIKGIATILGLYNLYLLYHGMRSLKEPPADKIVPYFVVTLVAAFLISFVIIWLADSMVYGIRGPFLMPY